MTTNAPPNLHSAHQQSLANLEAQTRVSGFAFDQTQHVSRNPSDLGQVEDAQLVTTNKDGFVVQPEEAPERAQPPPKRTINVPDNNANSNNNNGGNVDFGNTTTTDFVNTIASDSYAPETTDSANANANASANATDATNNNNANDIGAYTAPKDAGYENFFGNGAAAAAATDAQAPEQTQASNAYAAMGSAEEQNPYQSQSKDVFSALDDNNNNPDTVDDVPRVDEEDDQKQQGETFLSVWQAQHREMLAEKAEAERKGKEEALEQGRELLADFQEKRQARVEQSRKDAHRKESELMEEYNSVFQHGTIWQQVAKLVDLSVANPSASRMQDLLIRLKNVESDSKTTTNSNSIQ